MFMTVLHLDPTVLCVNTPLQVPRGAGGIEPDVRVVRAALPPRGGVPLLCHCWRLSRDSRAHPPPRPNIHSLVVTHPFHDSMNCCLPLRSEAQPFEVLLLCHCWRLSRDSRAPPPPQKNPFALRYSPVPWIHTYHCVLKLNPSRSLYREVSLIRKRLPPRTTIGPQA